MKYLFQILLLLACFDCAAQLGSRQGFTESNTGDKNTDTFSVALKKCPPVFSCPRFFKKSFDFAGRVETINNHLFWKTVTEETDIENFVLEHALDTIHFTAINYVNEAYSHGRQGYDFTDLNPCACKNYYRIKTGDAEGEATYSQVIMLDNSTRPFAVYPVPARDAVNISMYSQAGNKNIFTVYDMAGKQVLRQEVALQKGNNSIPLSISSLPKGMFWIKVFSADGTNNVVARFIKE